MATVLSLLFLLSLIALIAGLIKPALFSRFLGNDVSRKKVGLIFGITTFVLFIVIATTNSSTKKTETKSTSNSNTKTATKSAQKTSDPKPQTIKYVFDVPSLVGKNIDEIRVVLGEPVDNKAIQEPNQSQLDLGVDEWDNTFKKGNVELLVTFKVKSRKVVDFFIAEGSGTFNDSGKPHALEIGNLKDNSNLYKVGFVKAIKDDSSYTGVTVTPK